MTTAISVIDWNEVKILPHRPADHDGVRSIWYRGRLYYQGCCRCGQLQIPPAIHVADAQNWQCNRCHQASTAPTVGD
jgi:hypothetical protein